jgi:transcriptional regulator with XRE-family HTH domain
MKNPVTLDWSPLRIIRHKLGISQAATGALIGVSGGMICHVEHSRRGLSAAQLVGLAVGLGYPMHALFNSTIAKEQRP